MSNGKQNPGDDNNFDFDVDAPPTSGPTREAGSEEFDYGNGGFEFEPGPEAPEGFDGPDDRVGDNGGDDFNDAQGDEGAGFDLPPEPGDDGAPEEDPVPGQSQGGASKYLFPAIAAGVAGLLGVGGYVVLGDLLGSSGGPDDAPAAGPQFAGGPSVEAPRVPGPPLSLPGALPAPRPAVPSLPSAQPSLPSPSQAALPGLPGPASGPLPGLPGTGQASPIITQAPAPVVPAALPSGIEDALRDLTEKLGQLPGALTAIQAEQRQTRTELIQRFDRTDGNVAEIGRKVEGVEARVGGLEERLSALETARAPAARPAPVQAQAPATPTRGVNARVAATRQAPRPQAAQVRPAASPNRVLQGWTLRGVSRTEVLVERAGGELLKIEIGKSLPGVGNVQSVRRYQDTWEVVTSGGIVRP